MKVTLVRSYYEKLGNFDNIEKTKFYPLILEYSKKIDVPVKEYLYKCLGYQSDINLTSENRYRARKLFIESKTDKTKVDELVTIIRVKKDKKIVDRMNDLDAMGIEMNFLASSKKYKINLKKFKDIFENEVLMNIAKVYSRFLRNNQVVKLRTEDGNVLTLGSLLQDINHLHGYDAMIQAVNAPIVSKMLDLSELTFKPAAIEKAMIVGSKFIINRDIDLAKYKGLIKECGLVDAIFGILTVPLSRRDELKDLLLKNVSRVHIDDSEYLKILDYAHTAGCTVNDLCEVLGVPQAHYDEMFEHIGALVAPVDESSMLLLNPSDDKYYQPLLLTKADFRKLYEEDLFKAIKVEKGVAMMNNNTLLEYLGRIV